MVARFLFGAGEAGCFPNLTKAFTTWLPRERTNPRAGHHVDVRALGRRVHSAAGGRGTFALMSWRWAFVLFGAIGVIWAVFFYRLVPGQPARSQECQRSRTSAARRTPKSIASGHGDVPWGKLLRSRSIWLLWAQYFFLSYPLVLLHHLAADVSEGSFSGDERQRSARGSRLCRCSLAGSARCFAASSRPG